MAIKTGNEKLDNLFKEDPNVEKDLQSYIESQEAGLRSKRDELLGKLNAANSIIDKVQELGGMEQIEQRIKTPPKDTGNDEQVNQLRKQVEQMRNSAIQERISSKLSSAILKEGGVAMLLEPVLKSRVRGSVDDSGLINVEVLDKSGNIMFVNGEKASVEHLVKEFKSDNTFSGAFIGNKSSGTGSNNAGGTDTPPPPTDNPYKRDKDGNINIKKASELYKRDPDTARRLAKEAGFSLYERGV